MQQTKYLTRQTEPMAEYFGVKLLAWLGIPMFLLGWLGDLDEVKAWISYIAGGIMMAIWFCFKCDRWYHEWWLRREERRNLRKKRQQ